MTKAIYVQEIVVKDPETGNLVEMEVYKHENGGMFAIDSSYLDSECGNDEPIIPDPFQSKFVKLRLTDPTNTVTDENPYANLSKKEFAKRCSYHYYGRGKNKRNAFYFDWKSERDFVGFKFMVKTSVQNYKKAELLDIFYQWVTGKIQQPDYYVTYRYAEKDKDRFKVPLMG